MNQNIEKFLLYLSRAGKLIILACPTPKRNFWFGALLFFVISGLLFPLYPAHAILHGFAADAIGKAIGWMIAAYILTIPAAILTIASILLGWSIDPWFITLPYTSGGVIDVGWPVVRDLANMFIVLVLVIIGLATALRLEEYRARKTLPILIMIALLINFTPVILGVIVDFANILMNFFLGGLTGGKIIGGVFTNISNMIASDLGGFNFFNPIALLGFFIKILVIALFMFFAAIVFFLFAILFIMRRVAIWLLVIMSPIAFVFYILPATRGWFRTWWNQFLQWTFIGVFAAFFLWLGDHMIGIASMGGLTGAVAMGWSDWSNPVAAILNEVLPYGIALAFLLLGFFAALSTSAMGASGVISFAQRGTKAAATVLSRGAWERGKILAGEKWAKSPKARKISERMALAKKAPGISLTEAEKALPFKKKLLKPAIWWKVPAGAAVAAVTAPTWAVGRAVGKAGMAVREAGLKEINKKEKEAMQKWETPEMKLANLRSAATKTERVAILGAAWESTQFKPLGKLGFSEEEKKNIIREALEIHPQAFQKFREGEPSLAVKIARDFPEEVRRRARMIVPDDEKEKYKDNILNKIIDEMKVENIPKMAPNALKDVNIQHAMHAFWGGPQISAAARAFGREFVDVFNEEMQKRGSHWYWNKETNTGYNQKVIKYVSRTTAQELGFSKPPDTGTEKVPGPQPPSEAPPPPPGPPPPKQPRGRPGMGTRPLRERPPRPPRGRPGLGGA